MKHEATSKCEISSYDMCSRGVPGAPPGTLVSTTHRGLFLLFPACPLSKGGQSVGLKCTPHTCSIKRCKPEVSSGAHRTESTASSGQTVGMLAWAKLKLKPRGDKIPSRAKFKFPSRISRNKYLWSIQTNIFKSPLHVTT